MSKRGLRIPWVPPPWALPLLVSVALGEPACAGAPPAHGGSGERLAVDPGLTLHEVVGQALARHPNARVIAARAEEADALARQANSALAGVPAVALRHQTDQVGSRQGLREWETGLSLPLWWPGQRRARQALAGEAARVAESAGGALELEVAGAVRESLGEVALLRNRAALAEREWRTAEALASDVARRVQAGELARTDLLLAQDEALTRQGLHLSALAELANGAQRYRSLTGLDRVPPALAEPLSARHEVADDHPRLAQALAAVDRARAESAAVRLDRSGSPEITVGTRHEKAESGSAYSNTLGVIVRIPLPSRAHTAPRQAQAALAVAEAEAARDLARRELERDLDQVSNRLQATREAVDLARRQNGIAQENLRLARKAFALGESDLVSLLRVQALAFTAERNLEQRKLDLELDIARYNQAAGVMP